MWTTSYRHTEEFKENLRQTLLLSKLNLSAILGKAEIYLNDFLNLEVGDVIRLDSFYDEPIDLEIEERPIFKVKVGKSKGFYSVKIVDKNRELLERLLIEESIKKKVKNQDSSEQNETTENRR
jgi:flagellar motor switch protein FliM